MRVGLGLGLVLTLALGVAPLAAQAKPKDAMQKGDKPAMNKADGMSKGGMAHDSTMRDSTGKGAMSHDSMSDGAMSHDAMSHDGMAKDAMGKDAMGKDAMGKDAMGKDAMGKDAMGHDGMSKDATGHDAMGGGGMGKDAMAGHDAAMSHDAMGDGSSMGLGAMGHDAMPAAAHGAFVGAAGRKVAGSFTVVTEGGRSRVQLSDDFRAPRGSGVYLVLTKGSGAPDDGAVYLGELTRAAGAQTFDLPAGTDIGRFDRLVLWSRKDKIALGSAELAAGGGMMHK
jgi:pentapeptide MXKDX repeat protein